MNDVYKRILITAVILITVIGIMVSFSFPDLFAMYYVPHFIFAGNIYTWVAHDKATCPWVSATWPPLYYDVTGMYLFVLENLKIFPTHIFYRTACPVLDVIQNKQFLFFAKLPFLLFHLASAWIFMQFFEKKRFLWFLFFLVNPIAIFVNFIQGQFDSIPTFFLMLSFYYAVKKDLPLVAALMLGIGGAYKHYPFLLLIPFVILLAPTYKKRILFILTAILPYILAAIPAYNADYLHSLTFSENSKMFQSGIDINGMHISFYILFYICLIGKLLLEKQKGKELLIKYSFLFSSIYFLTSFWFMQRILFLLPSLLLLAGRQRRLFSLLPFLSLIFFIYTLGMFPGLFDTTLLRPLFPAIKEFSFNYLFTGTLQSIIFSVMTGVLLWFIYLCYEEKQEHTGEVRIRTRDVALSTVPLGIYLVFLLCIVLTQK